MRASSVCIAISLSLLGCAAVEKAPINAASLVVQGVKFYFSLATPKEIPVIASGSGDTRQKAIDNALLAAVREAIGVFVVSEVTVINDKVISDIAANYSSGVVKEYKVIDCTKAHVIECKVSAKVSAFAFRNNLAASSTVTKVDGENLYGQYLTSRNTIEQRYKLTEYFLSKARTNGLRVNLTKFEIQPSTNNNVPVFIEYEVQFDKEYFRSLVSFLKVLEEDTGGGYENKLMSRRRDPSSIDPHTYFIQWATTGLFDNRVWIHTYDRSFHDMIKRYEFDDISIKIRELNICERVTHIGLFAINWHGMKRTKLIEIEPDKLKNLRQITLELGC